MNYTQNEKILQITDETLIVGLDVASETHYARACVFRANPATHFGRFRPPVSVLNGHFLAVTEIGGRFSAK